jgi:hypothetical protein
MNTMILSSCPPFDRRLQLYVPEQLALENEHHIHQDDANAGSHACHPGDTQAAVSQAHGSLYRYYHIITRICTDI